MNKTTIKKRHKTKKNSLSYRKLRRWVLPAVLGAASVSYTHLDVYKRQSICLAIIVGIPELTACTGIVKDSMSRRTLCLVKAILPFSLRRVKPFG